MHVCIYVHVCRHMFIFVYIYAEACLSACACVCRCMFMYVYMCVGACLHVHMDMHVHGCGYMLVHVWRLEADMGHIPQFLSTLFYWGRVLLAHSACLASLPALGIRCLCFQVLRLHVDCYAHLAFLWIVGIWTRVSMLVWWAISSVHTPSLKTWFFFYFLFIGLRFFSCDLFSSYSSPSPDFFPVSLPTQLHVLSLASSLKKYQINQSIKQIKNLKGKNS